MSTALHYTDTENSMQEALLSLLKSKKIENIKVTELAKNAGICRATFYLYYSDIYELYEKVVFDALDSIKQVTCNSRVSLFEDVLTSIYSIYQVASKHRNIFCALLINSYDIYFHDYLKAKITYLIRQKASVDEISANIVSLLSANIMSIIQIWLEQKYDFSSVKIRTLTRQTLSPLKYCM